MRRLKTLRRPPIYPKTPGHLPCSSLTHPLPLSSRRPSVSFGGFGLRGMNKLADQGALDALTEHPIFWDGITEDDTILIAASGTLYSTPDEIRHVLELGPASIETESLGTDLTPNLKISIVRTDSPAKPDTIEATRDLVEFVENTMGLPLSVGRTGRNQEPKLIPRSLRPTAWGWCTSERPRLR